MTAEAWDGIPPSPHLAGRYLVQRVLPERKPEQVWDWQPHRGTWRNAIGGEVDPALLAGRFALNGPEAAPSPPPAMPPDEAWQQLSLFA